MDSAVSTSKFLNSAHKGKNLIYRDQDLGLSRVEDPTCTPIKGVEGGEGASKPLRPGYSHHLYSIHPLSFYKFQIWVMNYV